MKNYLLFYTDRFVPKRFDAYSFGPIILLPPSKKDDIGLLEHEKVHVNQFWRTLGINGLFYLLSKKFRLKYEVEAYRKQLEFCKDQYFSKQIFANFIAYKYNLNITYQEAFDLL